VAWRRGVNHLTTKPRVELLSIGRISETPDLDVFGSGCAEPVCESGAECGAELKSGKLETSFDEPIGDVCSYRP
jgi:hypothetical protein